MHRKVFDLPQSCGKLIGVSPRLEKFPDDAVALKQLLTQIHSKVILLEEENARLRQLKTLYIKASNYAAGKASQLYPHREYNQ